MTGVAGVLAEIRPHPMVSENFPCESLAIPQFLSLQSSNPLNVCSLRCYPFGYPVVLCFWFWFFLSTYRPLRYLTKLSGRSLLYTFLGMCPEKKQHNNTTTLNIVQPSLTIHHSRNLSSFPFEVCHWQTRTQHLGDLPSVLSMTRKSQKITTGQARVSQHGYVKKCEALPCLAKKNSRKEELRYFCWLCLPRCSHCWNGSGLG